MARIIGNDGMSICFKIFAVATECQSKGAGTMLPNAMENNKKNKSNPIRRLA